MHDIVDNFILLSLQNLWVPSPTFTKQRNCGILGPLVYRSYETRTELPVPFEPPFKHVIDQRDWWFMLTSSVEASWNYSISTKLSLTSEFTSLRIYLTGDPKKWIDNLMRDFNAPLHMIDDTGIPEYGIVPPSRQVFWWVGIVLVILVIVKMNGVALPFIPNSIAEQWMLARDPEEVRTYVEWICVGTIARSLSHFTINIYFI